MSLFFKFKGNQKGFSLVELIVSLSIVTALISVIVMSQSSYLDSAALGNLADEIGLTLSQAQAYGIAVRQVAPSTEDFSAAYGLTMSLLGSGSPTAYLFFVDKDPDGPGGSGVPNGSYDGTWDCITGGANECLEKKNILRGNYISEICVVRTNGADICNGIGRVDITFLRPNTAANLVFYNDGGQLYNPANLIGARVTLRSPGGLSRLIVVYKTGQISVQ